MSLPFIHIRLIKDSSPCVDKSIQVRYVYGNFLWTYKDNMFDKNHGMQLHCTEEVMHTFDAMMNTLLLDDDPFTFIQLDIPGFPSVLYRMNNVKTVIFDIRRLMLQALEKIPYYMSQSEIDNI